MSRGMSDNDEDTFDDTYTALPLFRRNMSRSGNSFRIIEMTELKQYDDVSRFTENSDTRIGPCVVASRLDDIKENRRLNRVEKVKKIVRKADWPIRHEVRKELWRELCKGKDFDSSKALYRSELENVIKSGTKTHSPQFLNEEGVVINNFDLNEQGSVKLLRLLTVIEHLRPEISSAPNIWCLTISLLLFCLSNMLYPLCALMLHYLDDADVFACIQHLLVSKGYLMTSPVEWAASSHTILALIKKHKPNAYTMLKRRCGTVDDVVIVKTLRDWLSWIFHGLPLSHVVRVVDCFLVEGHKFVTRAAIAIVYIWAKTLKNQMQSIDDLAGKSHEERVEAVKQELSLTAQQIQISTDTFIETAIRIRNLQKVAAEIMSALPARLQLVTPQLLFRLSNDGASFTHFWSRIDESDQTLILIKTIKGEKFGAYCSSSWAERNDRRERTKSKYFGTGESFVWQLDKELELPIIYGWVGNNNEHPDSCPQMFMAANDRLLVIGSGDGDAIRISEELTHGMSSSCRTFASPALVEGRCFDIHELEVFDVLTGT
uniref:Rab-GAP TBC domain-containing protein n=1 Tax=Heterorhabditis bacteriophora TaxID=37862 RepID=A0A1I7XV68_HETBA